MHNYTRLMWCDVISSYIILSPFKTSFEFPILIFNVCVCVERERKREKIVNKQQQKISCAHKKHPTFYIVKLET